MQRCLHAHKIDSLEMCRIKIDIIMLLQILHGTVTFNLYNGFQLHNGGHFNRSKKFKLFINEALNDITKTVLLTELLVHVIVCLLKLYAVKLLTI